MSTLFAQIEALNAKLTEAIAKESTAKASYDGLLAHEAELDRQRLYHMGNNDYPNAQIVSDDLRDNIRPAREIAGNLWNQRKAETKQALADLQAAKEALTASEQAGLSSQQQLELTQAQIQLATAQAQQATTQSQADREQSEANYMSQKAKYIVIAVVVLVITVTVLYFKFRKKAA